MILQSEAQDRLRSTFSCSQECTFMNTQKQCDFLVRKIYFLIYKHIRKYIDIYEHL